MSRLTRWVKGTRLHQPCCAMGLGSVDGAWCVALGWTVFEDVGEKPGEHHTACCVMWPLEGLWFEKEMLILAAKLILGRV